MSAPNTHSPGPAGSAHGDDAETVPGDSPSAPTPGKHGGLGENDSPERAELLRQYTAERIDQAIAVAYTGYDYSKRPGFPTRERVARFEREWSAMLRRERATTELEKVWEDGYGDGYSDARFAKWGTHPNPHSTTEAVLAKQARAKTAPSAPEIPDSSERPIESATGAAKIGDSVRVDLPTSKSHGKTGRLVGIVRATQHPHEWVGGVDFGDGRPQAFGPCLVVLCGKRSPSGRMVCDLAAVHDGMCADHGDGFRGVDQPAVSEGRGG